LQEREPIRGEQSWNEGKEGEKGGKKEGKKRGKEGGKERSYPVDIVHCKIFEQKEDILIRIREGRGKKKGKGRGGRERTWGTNCVYWPRLHCTI